MIVRHGSIAVCLRLVGLACDLRHGVRQPTQRLSPTYCGAQRSSSAALTERTWPIDSAVRAALHCKPSECMFHHTSHSGLHLCTAVRVACPRVSKRSPTDSRSSAYAVGSARVERLTAPREHCDAKLSLHEIFRWLGRWLRILQYTVSTQRSMGSRHTVSLLHACLQGAWVTAGAGRCIVGRFRTVPVAAAGAHVVLPTAAMQPCNSENNRCCCCWRSRCTAYRCNATLQQREQPMLPCNAMPCSICTAQPTARRAALLRALNAFAQLSLHCRCTSADRSALQAAANAPQRQQHL